MEARDLLKFMIKTAESGKCPSCSFPLIAELEDGDRVFVCKNCGWSMGLHGDF
jgi:ribosomal protein L37AE/L43A